MKRLIILFCLLIQAHFLEAQNVRQDEIDPEKLIEGIFQLQDDDIDYTELYDVLLSNFTNPVDINRASIEQLRSLYILSEQQIKAFDTYRSERGPLLSLYELQAIPTFDLPSIRRLLHFVKISPSDQGNDDRNLWRRVLEEKNNFLMLRYERILEEKKGFSPPDSRSTTRYQGSPGKWYARFRTSHTNDFSIGFTAEKDAGELLAFDHQKQQYGADFYSFHFQLKNRGAIKNVVLGDYQLQFGQGLVFGSGLNLGKGAETITTVRRVNSGVRPYTSLRETGHFRGAAVTARLDDHLDVTFLYSQLYQDAAIRKNENGSEFVNAIQSSGLHRTTSELHAKDRLTEQNAGVNFVYRQKQLVAGANYLFSRYSIPLIRNTSLTSLHEFAGQNNIVYSTFFNYSIENYTFFGEAGRSLSGGYGTVAGFIAPLSKTVETAVLFRRYGKNFHSFYGNAFGESSRNTNERGWYWGLKYHHNDQMSIAAYFDSFAFDWLKTSATAPSDGFEYLVRLNYGHRKDTRFYFQYRCQSKARNLDVDASGGNIPSITQGIKYNYLFNLDHSMSDHFSIKSRMQWSSFSFSNTRTTGFALMQDVNAALGRWKISSRIAVFDTDDFENRQYAFERDVLYLFSIPALSGKGTRSTLVLHYKWNRAVGFWLKYSRTHLRDTDTIGTGLEEINGAKRTLIRLQTRIRL